MTELISKIEAAESKDELEALGKQRLGIDIDKRRGIETLRAELLELAEAKAAEQSEEESDAEAPAAVVEDRQPEPLAPAPPEPPIHAAKKKRRMLKNTKNGRLFPWTAALAKNRHMKEV